MKKIILFLILITKSLVYSMEDRNLIQENSLPEKSVVLCNGDTCIQATITCYDDERDRRASIHLLDKNQLKLPEITPEFLAPYFKHNSEDFEETSPMGPISFNLTHSTYVLRNGEKVFGFISYKTTFIKEPNQTAFGTIAFLYVEPAYQAAGEELLLTYALQDMSNKKVTSVTIMMHEDNAVQRSIVEKIGFQDFNQQVKFQQERVLKNATKEQQEALAEKLENQKNHCYYVKILEENLTEEMKNPTPIESSLLNITKANFEQEVLNAINPVVIDVYTNWCGPCRQFAPIFEKVAEAHANYTFVRFNCVEEEQELAKELGIEAFPTILFIKNKKVVGKETGFMSQEILQQKLAEYFN